MLEEYIRKYQTFLTHTATDKKDVIVGCVLLASKIEETIKKSRDLLLAAHPILYPEDTQPDPKV